MSTNQIVVFSIGCYLVVGYLTAWPVLRYAESHWKPSTSESTEAIRRLPWLFVTVIALMWPVLLPVSLYGFASAVWRDASRAWLHWRLWRHTVAMGRIAKKLTAMSAAPVSRESGTGERTE